MPSAKNAATKPLFPDFDQSQTIGIGASPWLQREEAMAHLRSSYEKYLTNIKSYRRGWANPRVYLSCLPEQKEWAEKLIHDLHVAGVFIVEKSEDLDENDFIVVLDTLAYQKAFQASSATLDMEVVRARLRSKKLLSIGCEGEIDKHDFKRCNPGNFCDNSHYRVSLFNLVMNLYAIPLDHKGFEPLRRSLHEQWERMPIFKDEPQCDALKIFISYSHKDEAFKDELVTMLAGLQRRGIVDAWQDRRIEPGEEWHKAIQTAMDECDLALLLISSDYLASRFIQEDEQPILLKRRDEMQTRIVPIIVRPCIWESEPVLKAIQAMPKDGKAVISFSKEDGDRDQVWTTIAQEIVKRAKKEG